MMPLQHDSIKHLHLVQPANDAIAQHVPKLVRPRSNALNDGACRFDIYCADRVSLTSTLFGGGDWHWRLIATSGEILIDCGGYASRSACRSAVELLRQEAAAAGVFDHG